MRGHTSTSATTCPVGRFPGRSCPTPATCTPSGGCSTRPEVVVRAGLEAVGLMVASGRVRSVEVRSRRDGATGPTVAIAADLVVDAGGRRPMWTDPLPDGLVLIGAAVRPVGSSRGITAELAAAVLGRSLAEHLGREADLAGFSATAQRALARAGAGAHAVVH